MNRILVGIDFSPPSRTALEQAVEFTEGGHGKILALHVVEQTLINSLADFSHLNAEEIIDALELRLSRFAAEVPARDTVIETKLAVGHSVKQFATVADSFDPDLVILGAWGNHGEHADRAGFTAKQIVQECRCDTLLARETNSPSGGVLACIDFSPYDRSVVCTANSLARLEDAPLEILHVFYPPWKMEGAGTTQKISDADFAQEYKALLQGRIENLLTVVEIGPTRAKSTVLDCQKHSDGILSYVKEQQPGIVVLGARGSSCIDSMILGRIAERIVTGADTSVYIVKRPL